MKDKPSALTIIFSIAIIFLSLFYFRRPKPGIFLCIPDGIKVDYLLINLENSEVTAYITYKKETYMRIQHNVLTEETKVDGSIESIKTNRLFRSRMPLTDAECIEMVQHSARFFIENQITNPDTYYAGNSY